MGRAIAGGTRDGPLSVEIGLLEATDATLGGRGGMPTASSRGSRHPFPPPSAIWPQAALSGSPRSCYGPQSRHDRVFDPERSFQSLPFQGGGRIEQHVSIVHLHMATLGETIGARNMAYYRVDSDCVVIDVATFTGASSGTLQAAFDLAVSSGIPIFARPATYELFNVSIGGPIDVKGVPGKVIFRMAADAVGIFYIGAFSSANFSGIIFDGANRAFSIDSNLSTQGLINIKRDSGTIVSTATFEKCVFRNSLLSGIGVADCRLNIIDCQFENCADKGIGVASSDQISISGSSFVDVDYAVRFWPNGSSNVHISKNSISGCRRNGFTFEPTGSTKVHKNITLSENLAIVKPSSSDMWSVRKTDESSTGAEGNGILIFLAENVAISDNIMHKCQYSAIRINVSSFAAVTGNICRDMGETAIYLETPGISNTQFASVVSSNVVQDSYSGIAVVNFNQQGRFASITGNLIRGITTWGIYAEGDVSVSGNNIWGAAFGIVLGTGIYTGDLNATSNVIRDTTLGIGVSTDTSKYTLISSNLIAGYSSGAIRGVSYDGGINPPVIITGAEICPANLASSSSGNIYMIGNIKRSTL